MGSIFYDHYSSIDVVFMLSIMIKGIADGNDCMP